MATSLLDQLQPFVGMNLDQFESKAKELGYETRVVSKDGESVPVTMDLRNDRVNVIVTTAV